MTSGSWLRGAALPLTDVDVGDPDMMAMLEMDELMLNQRQRLQSRWSIWSKGDEEQTEVARRVI